jgi:hypothetical protein
MVRKYIPYATVYRGSDDILSILFCLPGIYLALTGLGAGGGQQSSQAVASTTNA